MHVIIPAALGKLRGSSTDLPSTAVNLKSGPNRALLCVGRSFSLSLLSTLQIRSGPGKYFALFFFFFSLSGCGEEGVDVSEGVGVGGAMEGKEEEVDGEGDEAQEGMDGRLLVWATA